MRISDVLGTWKGTVDSANNTSGSVHTDGMNLYSYDLKIGYTDGEGNKILYEYSGDYGVSHTTSMIVGKAKSFCDYIETPLVRIPHRHKS